METVKVALVLLLLLTSVFSHPMDVDDSWREGSEQWPESRVIQDMLVRMIRKAGPRRYLGVTGRKDSVQMQTARKPRKFQTFVGLMGKRGFEDQFNNQV